MVKAGCLNTVDEVYGLHNIPFFDEGDIRVKAGADWAQAALLKITVYGKGGHGSTPHKIIDPISCAMQIFEALHTIKSRNIDSKQNVVINIGNVQSGSIYNVFPDEAFMQGTIRSFDKPTQEKIIERIEGISINMAKAMNCTVDLDIER